MVHQEERRKSRRWECMLLCHCEGEGFVSDGMIVDLSYGGAGINGTEKLPAEGTELLLTVLPLTEKVQLRSRVVWVIPEGQDSQKAQFGVQFTESPEKVKERLRSFFPSSLDW